MARFRKKVTGFTVVGRAVAGDLAGEPIVRVVLEGGESFVISPDSSGANNGWSLYHTFTTYTPWEGPDIIVLYDEMPPRKVEFCGSEEAGERYRAAFAHAQGTLSGFNAVFEEIKKERRQL